MWVNDLTFNGGIRYRYSALRVNSTYGLRTDDQGGFFIVVEGTQADEIVTVGFQLDTARFRQPRQGDILFEPG